MTQRKRRGRGASRHAPAPDATPAAGQCAACGATPPAQARFCHLCGAPLDGRPARGRRAWIAVWAAAALSIAGAALTAAYLIVPDRGDQPPVRMVRSESFPAPAVDLSTMSPREAADRLFNRVMSANERGDTAEALRFAPMAVQAYARVAELDADARYHLGLLHLLLDDLDGARAQIEALEQQVPRHLLALLLEHDVAQRTGDAAAAARATEAFAASYAGEIAAARPEYEAHEVSIRRFRTANAAPAAAAPAAAAPGAAATPAAAAAPGMATASNDAALFERRCAECHGHEAAGTDRGPPLVHRIYEPGHHGDEAFYRAVRDGVRSHHWPFGDMQPIPGIPDDEIARIVAYVRALQRASGIQ